MRFRVLGPFEVRTASGVLLRGTRRKQRLLLALLVLQANRKVTVDELVDQMWGQRPPASAMANLQSYVAQLRRLLADEAPRLETGDGSYQLHAGDEELEHVVFEHLVRNGQADCGNGRWTAALQHLTSALGLWRGEAVAEGVELPEPLRPVVTRLEELRVTALEENAEARLRLGQHHGLDAELGLLTSRYPHRERLWGQLMLVRYRCGRRAEALTTYQQVYRLLDRELGIRPGPALREMHQRILDDDPALAPLTDSPDSPDSAPAPTPAPAPAPTPTPEPVPENRSTQRQLPLDIPHFTGRTRLLEELERCLLDREHVPVVTLCGSPGVGKTALATHVGHRLRHAFPDGQWYVKLREAADGQPRAPYDVLGGLLRALGQGPGAVPDTLEERAAALRAALADSHVLMVLDDAVTTDQIRPLLPGTPGSAVLVTSRYDQHGLAATHGAHCFVLEVLERAESQLLLANIIGHQRIRAEPAAAMELGRLCAQLPLALNIAAANLAASPGRSLSHYVAELVSDDRLGHLAIAGDHSAAVRAAFDRSFHDLSPATARLFRLLGLVPGGDFTAETAGALLGEGQDTGSLLDELTAAGLIQHYVPGRYQFHDLLRLYAVEHSAGEPGREQAWQRLCDWAFAATESAVAFRYAPPVWIPHPHTRPAQQFAAPERALDWLETERFNLVALIVRAAEVGPHANAWLLANRLCKYFYQRQHWTEDETAVKAGLHAAQQAGDELAEAVMRHSLAYIHTRLGDLSAARDANQQALTVYRRSGFAVGEAAILINQAGVHEAMGQLRQARANLTRSLEVLQALEAPDGELLGDALSKMSAIHASTGELALGQRSATDAIEAYRSKEDIPDTVWPLVIRASIHRCRAQYDQAEKDITEALLVCHEHDLRHHEADARNLLAQVRLATDDLEAAKNHAEQALQTAHAAGDRRSEAGCHTTLADAHRLTNHPQRAVTCLHEALELARHSGYAYEEADAHIGMAHTLLVSGDPAEAADHAQRALRTARSLDLRIIESRGLAALALAHHALGDHAAATRHSAQARLIQHETGYLPSPEWTESGAARDPLAPGRTSSPRFPQVNGD